MGTGRTAPERRQYGLPESLKTEAEVELGPSREITQDTVDFVRNNIGGEKYGIKEASEDSANGFGEWCTELKKHDTRQGSKSERHQIFI